MENCLLLSEILKRYSKVINHASHARDSMGQLLHKPTAYYLFAFPAYQISNTVVLPIFNVKHMFQISNFVKPLTT